MKLRNTLAILLLVSQLISQDQTLISFESFWQYLDDGSNQGTAWRSSNFNDSSWSLGQAILGYGEGNENTVISYGGDPDDKHITSYFRHHFVIEDLSKFENFLIKLKKDDGAIVYINGSEVMRSNFGRNSYDYLDESYSTISSEEEDIIWEDLVPTSFFQNGENVIAVEVHQTDPESSDVIFDLELIGFDSTPGLYREPYLQKATEDGITIKWKTDIPTDSKVWYGKNLDDMTNFVESNELTCNHEVNISGLESNTQYYYRIGTNQISFIGGTLDYYFKTNPAIGTVHPTRIWITGDAGTGKDEQANVRDAYLNFIGQNGKSDLWLMMGDNAYEHGRESDYHMGLFTVYQDILRNTVSFPTSGNHDLLGEANANVQFGTFYDIFALPTAGESGGVPSGTESYYSFDYGNIHFVCLESTDIDRDSTAAMATWLKNDLQNTNADWLIAYWHFAPYTKVDHNSDDPDDWSGRAIEMRENMNPILEKYGVDLVLSGHSHGYERSYLLDGHYGYSNTLTDDMILDNTSGSLYETGAYAKPNKLTAHNGTVYVVCGNSGKVGDVVDDGPFPGVHPVMHETNTEFAGSVIIDVIDNFLEGKFLNENGIVQDYFHIVKENTNAIQNIESFSQIEIYPNPATDEVNISLTNDQTLINSEIQIYSKDGKMVKQFSLENYTQTGKHQFQIDLPDLPVGIYTIKLVSNDALLESKMLIIK